MSKHIKVKRAFCINGERQDVGKTLEVSDAFAGELVSVGKAEYAEPPLKLARAETQKAPDKDESQNSAKSQKGAK